MPADDHQHEHHGDVAGQHADDRRRRVNYPGTETHLKIGGIAQLVRRLVQRLLLQAIALLLGASRASPRGRRAPRRRGRSAREDLRGPIPHRRRREASRVPHRLQPVEQMSALLRGRTRLVRRCTLPSEAAAPRTADTLPRSSERTRRPWSPRRNRSRAARARSFFSSSEIPPRI